MLTEVNQSIEANKSANRRFYEEVINQKKVAVVDEIVGHHVPCERKIYSLPRSSGKDRHNLILPRTRRIHREQPLGLLGLCGFARGRSRDRMRAIQPPLLQNPDKAAGQNIHR